MKFLIIGSNSFSGSSFVRHLLRAAHDVIGISRSAEPHVAYLSYRWDTAGQGCFEFHQLDLNSDLDLICELLNDCRPECVVNFAAQGMVGESWLTPEDWYQTNVVAQVKLHDQLRRMAFLERYVHVSTPEVYGSTQSWTREHLQFAPSSPYAVSRAACDLHLMSFFSAYAFPVIFTRAANVYGPGQQLYRIIPRAVIAALTNETLDLHGGGHSERCFIHIDDVATATERIALEGTPGETYHISTRDPVSIRRLVEMIADRYGLTLEQLANEAEDRLGKDDSYLLDSTKLREELNWKPEISLESGIKSVMDWASQHLSFLGSEARSYQHRK
jgi:dTDP-glucose 4,6-dehydratase